MNVLDLIGLIVIPAKNRMAGKARVIGVDSSNLTSSITVKNFVELPSKLVVYSDEVIIQPGYPPVLGSQRRASLFVPHRSNIIGRISITPQNRMSGLIEIVEPPIYTIELPSIQDAFVRSNIPTLNYGTESVMVVGYRRDLNDRFRSVIQFDTSIIPENSTIRSAKLKIYNTTDNQYEHQIGIYTAAAPWEETGVTWANQPAIKDIVSVENIKDSGYTNIDVTEIVTNWYENKEANYGFIIKAMNESYGQTESFLTRESSVNKPYIELKYTLNIIYSAGRSQVPSNVFVYGVGQSSLPANIQLREFDDGRDLPARIHVLNLNYWLEANIVVSRKDLVSNIVIQRFKDDDLLSSIRVALKDQSILNGKVTISRYFIKGNFKVSRIDSTEIPASINLIQRIPDYREIPSSLFVRKYTNDSRTLSSIIRITRNQISGKFAVKQFGQKDLSANIQLIIHNNLPSKLVINRKEIIGQLKVHYYSQIPGSIIVKVVDEILGHIEIPHRKDLRGSIDIIHASHLPSNIYVLSGYLRANIIIPAYGESVLLGRGIVRVRGISEIYSTLFVGGDNIPGGYIYIL